MIYYTLIVEAAAKDFPIILKVCGQLFPKTVYKEFMIHERKKVANRTLLQYAFVLHLARSLRMIELDECPFCEGNAEIVRYGDRKVSTQYACQNCGCFLETGETFNHGTQWNTRPREASIIQSNEFETRFTIQVAHILICDNMTGLEKLRCIKLRYQEMNFPEIPLTDLEERLLARIK